MTCYQMIRVFGTDLRDRSKLYLATAMFALGEKRLGPPVTEDEDERNYSFGLKHARLVRSFETLVLAVDRQQNSMNFSSRSSEKENIRPNLLSGKENIKHGNLLSPEQDLRDTKALSCKCRRSKCLKQYCECYRAGEFCGGDCECDHCMNQAKHEDQRQFAMEQTKRSSTFAFAPDWKALSVGDPESTNSHPKGCRCRRSKCRKKYCECYQMAVLCTSKCECMNCHNKTSLERKTKAISPIRRLLETPEPVITSRTTETGSYQPKRALSMVAFDDEEKPMNTESFDDATPTTQRNTSMASCQRSPFAANQKANVSNAMDVTDATIVSGATDLESKNLSSDCMRGSASSSRCLAAPTNNDQNKSAKARNGCTPGPAHDMSSRNESIISMDSSMDAGISWSDLDFCSSPSFMDFDTNDVSKF